jgi:hypothetical protein
MMMHSVGKTVEIRQGDDETNAPSPARAPQDKKKNQKTSRDYTHHTVNRMMHRRETTYFHAKSSLIAATLRFNTQLIRKNTKSAPFIPRLQLLENLYCSKMRITVFTVINSTVSLLRHHVLRF